MMNLETEAGFEEAKAWTAQFISQIAEGGVWGVPRSGSGYRFWHETKKYECIVNGEPCIERVLKALGYSALTTSDSDCEGATCD